MGFNTFPCNPYPISTDELNKGNNDDLNNRVAALESDVSDLNSQKTNQITIAPFFSAEASYDPGDLVYYNGLSYRCVNSHEGAWDADDFAATTIANELSSLMSGLTKIKYARGRATVQNGYFTLTNTGTTLTSGVVISLMRNDAEGDAYNGLIAYTAITTANELLVYIRKADGTSPENGTTVSYCYVAFN